MGMALLGPKNLYTTPSALVKCVATLGCHAGMAWI